MSCYETAVRCSGGPQPGALGLMDALLFVYGDEGASSWGIYNCRNTNTPGGSSTRSVHSEGRAGDLRILPQGSALGYTVANQLADVADQLHLQFIIWARKKWGCSYSPVGQDHRDWLAYGGYAHLDHVHWELDWEGARVKRETMRGLAIPLLGGAVDMTPEQEAKLDRAITLSEQILDSAGVRYPDGPTLQKSLVKSVDTDENPATPKVPLEHLNVLSDALDAKFAEVEKRLIRIEEQTAPPT